MLRSTYNYCTLCWNQSGLDESSGRNSTTFVNCFAFRVHLMFCWVNLIITYYKKWMFLSNKMGCSRNSMLQQNKTTPAASLFSRKQGLGIPLHVKMSCVLINIDSCPLLVLNRVLYFNCVALAIAPSLAPCYWCLLEPDCRWTLAHHTHTASAGGLKKGSIASAKEGINSKGNIIDMWYLV